MEASDVDAHFLDTLEKILTETENLPGISSVENRLNSFLGEENIAKLEAITRKYGSSLRGRLNTSYFPDKQRALTAFATKFVSNNVGHYLEVIKDARGEQKDS